MMEQEKSEKSSNIHDDLLCCLNSKNIEQLKSCLSGSDYSTTIIMIFTISLEEFPEIDWNSIATNLSGFIPLQDSVKYLRLYTKTSSRFGSETEKQMKLKQFLSVLSFKDYQLMKRVISRDYCKSAVKKLLKLSSSNNI